MNDFSLKNEEVRKNRSKILKFLAEANETFSLKKSKMLKFSTLINLKGWRQLEVLYFKTLTIYLKVIDNLRTSRFLQNSHIKMDIFLSKITIFDPQLNIYILNWSFLGVEVKVDSLGGSERSNWVKVDGLKPQKWTVQNDIKWTVYESGRSKKRKWTVHKKWNWTALKSAWEVKKGWKWAVHFRVRPLSPFWTVHFPRLLFGNLNSETLVISRSFEVI